MIAVVTLALLSGLAHADPKGDTSCKYGELGCNPCVANVEKQFDAIENRPESRIAYHYRKGDKLPPENIEIENIRLWGHVQGFTRLPGIDGDNWFAISRSRLGNGHGGAGVLFAKMTDLSGKDGDAMMLGDLNEGANIELDYDRVPENRSARYYYPTHGSDHPGGLQALGRMLVVPAECSSASVCRHAPATVDFLDVTDPAHIAHLNRLTLDGSQGEPGQLPIRPNAAFAAVTRLEDGKLLAFFAGARTESGWFYESEASTLKPETTWKFRSYFTADQVLPSKKAWDVMYQSGSFINECGTGRIYLAAMGRKGLARRFDLYRVRGNGGIQLERVAAHKLGISALRYCNPRGGSSAHVTPGGKLVIYCAAKQGSLFGDLHRFAEYAE